jgi:hypothetical protein
MSKKNLKNNPEKIFITEDVTKTRQFIVKELNTQKRDNKIHSFWTFDGRILAKGSIYIINTEWWSDFQFFIDNVHN